jgi:WhiB family transcriptional regulator, redox-sensing transcriptional regulator
MATPRRTVRIAATSKPTPGRLDWRAQMARRTAQTAPRLDEDIERRAACAGQDTDVFFPHASGTAAVEKAKAVCRSCPVTQACLMQALRNGDEFAVLGGTTPDERRLIRRQLAARKRELKGAA